MQFSYPFHLFSEEKISDAVLEKKSFCCWASAPSAAEVRLTYQARNGLSI